MRYLLLLSVCLNSIFSLFAQTISYDDFKEVIPFLQKEDYESAYKKTATLLNNSKNDTSDLHGIVLYMNIYCMAGMVVNDEMKPDEFSKKAKQFIGQKIVMAAHPCVDSSANAFNSLQFRIDKGQYQGETTTANKAGTSILCFEYFNFANDINPSDYIGQNVRCAGIIQSIEVNPSRAKLWISRIHVGKAFARVMNP